MEKNVFEYDNLVLGNFPIYTREIEIADGEEIKRGDLLIKNADGKYKKVKKEEGEGENKTGGLNNDSVIRIATEDIESTNENRITMGYVTGEFRKDAIGVPEGFNINQYIDVLDKKFIFIK